MPDLTDVLDKLSPEKQSHLIALLTEPHPHEGTQAWYAQARFGSPDPASPEMTAVQHYIIGKVRQAVLNETKANRLVPDAAPVDIADKFKKRKEERGLIGIAKEEPIPSRKRRTPKATHNARAIYEKDEKPYTAVPEEDNTVILNTGGPHRVVHLKPDEVAGIKALHVCDSHRYAYVSGKYNMFSQDRLPQDTDILCDGVYHVHDNQVPPGACLRFATMQLVVTYAC